jgi:hypothetical protein
VFQTGGKPNVECVCTKAHSLPPPPPRPSLVPFDLAAALWLTHGLRRTKTAIILTHNDTNTDRRIMTYENAPDACPPHHLDIHISDRSP